MKKKMHFYLFYRLSPPHHDVTRVPVPSPAHNGAADDGDDGDDDDDDDDV